MHGRRIMQPGADAVLLQGIEDGGPAFGRHAQRINVPDMAAARNLERQLDVRDAGKRLRIPARYLPARLGPRLQMAQLDAEDRALDAVHAVVEALEKVVVFPVLAP